jgi:Zn-dependent protease
VFGIQLAVHVSFFLLLAYYGYDGWKDGGLVGLSWSISLIVLFFVCVVLHELGHSLTARRFGVRVPRILLLPIGGMAEFDRIPTKPSEELLITAAGPAVNFALVILLMPLCWRTLLSGNEVARFSSANFIFELWFGNLLMGTFNLLPVFPWTAVAFSVRC